MYWQPWRWAKDGWLGAGLVVAFTGLSIVASLWLEAPFVAFIAAVGMPVGAALGFRAGSEVLWSEHPLGLAIRTAAQATLIVVTLLMVVAVVAPFARGQSDVASPIMEIVFGLVVGPVYVLFFGFPAALAVAVASVTIRRAFGARRQALAALLGVAFVAIGVAGGALAADALRRDARRAAGLPDLEAAGWLTLARAATRLEYVVVNHSRQTFVLAVNETTGPGESRGSVGGVEPCRAWAELVPLGPDWSVHMAPDPGAETDAQFEAFDRPPIATSADTPGRDPRIRIDVAADGTAHVTRDQPFPSDAEFSASAC